jgi:hypothetical protein
MTDRRDDDFRVRPNAPKNRGKGQGQSFVSKVLKQTGKASSGKSTMRRPGGGGKAPAPASGPARAWGAATRRRASRGEAHAHVAARDHQDAAGQPAAGQPAVARQAPALHRARRRGRDGEPGRAYGPQTDAADLDAFKERCADDRHHFRFIVSPEDGAELDDLRTYTRHLMGRMEADLGTGWIGWPSITGTPTTRTPTSSCGRDDTGKDLIIAGDYIADGFRHRAAELATEWLGPRTELEIQQTLQREVEQERWTSLDRTLNARPATMAGCRSNAQRTETATPAPAADRPAATLAAPGPGRRDAARHLGRPCR